jgi:hypothetical protein
MGRAKRPDPSRHLENNQLRALRDATAAIRDALFCQT